jgi:hypothetical protein
MREIIVVEDQRLAAKDLGDYLRSAGLKEPEWKIAIWYIDGVKAYESYLKEAAITTARIMVADLAFIDRELGPLAFDFLNVAQPAAAAKSMSDGSSFWTWDKPKKSHLLPGAVLIQSYVEAQTGDQKIPFRKHVWIASTFHEDARKWCERLQSRAIVGWSGRMDQETVADEVYKFIRYAYEDWPAILWSKETENWFRGEADFDGDQEADDLVDHDPSADPAKLDRQKVRVRQFLSEAFGFKPPSQWFDGDQFSYLYDCMKALTGYYSCANGLLQDRNVYIGTLELLAKSPGPGERVGIRGILML